MPATATFQNRPPRLPEPPADVRFFTRENVTWDRPVFKAPPLELDPRFVDSEHFARELQRIDLAAS